MYRYMYMYIGYIYKPDTEMQWLVTLPILWATILVRWPRRYQRPTHEGKRVQIFCDISQSLLADHGCVVSHSRHGRCCAQVEPRFIHFLPNLFRSFLSFHFNFMLLRIKGWTGHKDGINILFSCLFYWNPQSSLTSPLRCHLFYKPSRPLYRFVVPTVGRYLPKVVNNKDRTAYP